MDFSSCGLCGGYCRSIYSRRMVSHIAVSHSPYCYYSLDIPIPEAFVYQGITYTTREKVIDLGPLQPGSTVQAKVRFFSPWLTMRASNHRHFAHMTRAGTVASDAHTLRQAGSCGGGRLGLDQWLASRRSQVQLVHIALPGLHLRGRNRRLRHSFSLLVVPPPKPWLPRS